MYYEYDQPINPPENPYQQAQEFAMDEFNAKGGGRDIIEDAIKDAIEEYQAHFHEDYEDATTEALFGLLETLRRDI